MRIDTSGLEDFLSKLNKLQNKKGSILEGIVDKTSNLGQDILISKYNKIDYDLSENQIPVVTIEKEEPNKARVSAIGDQVAYIEFGTGTVGKNSISIGAKQKSIAVGAYEYNSGYCIRDDVPIIKNISLAGRNEYKNVIGWYKPDYALSVYESARYYRWISGINSDPKITRGSKRYYVALKRAYKYTHGTEGIRAGEQIYDTARLLEKELVNVAEEVIKEELK